MPLQRSNTADKFIVDRRKPHRNSDVARAVRKTRDRLSQQAGSLDFDRELLKLHARAMVVSAVAVPLLVLAVAAIGRLAGLDNQITIWALSTLLCYTIVAFMSRRVERTEAAELDPVQTRRDFLIGHFLCGLGWAWFAWIGCDTCQVDQFHVAKAMVLLVAMATTAVMASSLGGALVATFAIPVAVYAYTILRLWAPIEATMAALLIAALPFFGYVARNLNQASLMVLSFRSEKDALIAEVETAKSMSDEARRRAEDANLAKSRFLASMSHELRTPLNAIMGFSEVMRLGRFGEIDNEKYRGYVQDIHASATHLLTLIDTILDLATADSGRLTLHEERFSLAELTGTASAGISDTSRWRLSAAHWPTSPSPNCRVC